MFVERIEVEVSRGFTENCYIVSEDKKASHVIVVDPGAQAETILEALGNRIPDCIVLTHRHYDHIGALCKLVERTGAEVIAHALDAEAIVESTKKNPLTKMLSLKPVNIDRFVDESDSIPVGEKRLKVLYTPGHSVGSICLFDEEDHILLAGDTLFYEAVGRTDLPTGDVRQQQLSLRKLAGLPDDTRVHPGHDEDTSIGHEKRYGYLAQFI